MVGVFRSLLVVAFLFAVSCGESSTDGDGSSNGGTGDAGGSGGRGGGAGRGGSSNGGASSGRGGASGDAGAAGRGGSESTGGAGGSGGTDSGGSPAGGRGGSSTGGNAGSSVGGSAGVGEGGEGGDPPTCERPAAIDAPMSDSTYDADVAVGPAGVGVIYTKWPTGYEPRFSIYDPQTRTFGPSKLITQASAAIVSAHVAMTALPSGTFAAAWFSDGLRYGHLSVGLETDTPDTHVFDYSIRPAVADLDIAPYFNDRIAVAWQDLEGTDTNVVNVQIHDPADPGANQTYVITLPSAQEAIPQLFLGSDRLIVLLTEFVNNADYDIYLAEITPSTPEGPVVPELFEEGTTAPHPPLVFVDGGTKIAYGDGTNLLIANLGLDGTVQGPPTTVLPARAVYLNLFGDASGRELAWWDDTDGLSYTKLDMNDLPTGTPVLIAPRTENPVPVALLETEAGMLSAWYGFNDVVHLTPLCP